MTLRIEPILDLTATGVVVGRHSVWVPPSNGGVFGVKVPFQIGGAVQKYKHPTEATYPVESIAEEVAFLKFLEAREWGVPIGRWVYYQTVVSEHDGFWWADPIGAYGYEAADVDRFDGHGSFTVDRLRATGLVEGSDGAWNDIVVPERGNVRRGRLIDVRRSWFDRLRYRGPIATMPRYVEDRAALIFDLHSSGTFPFRERTQPYQEYYLDRKWYPAERVVAKRAERLLYRPDATESVVDLGCHTGGFLLYGYLMKMGFERPARYIGIDSQPEFIDLARRLARAAGLNICYRVASVEDDAILDWIATATAPRLDHLLMLSMTKHLSKTDATLWEIVDRLQARRTYLESNATTEDGWPLADAVFERGGVYVGDSFDRNRRRMYVVRRGD